MSQPGRSPAVEARARACAARREKEKTPLAAALAKQEAAAKVDPEAELQRIQSLANNLASQAGYVKKSADMVPQLAGACGGPMPGISSEGPKQNGRRPPAQPKEMTRTGSANQAPTKPLPPRFHDWTVTFPFLQVLKDNVDVLVSEMKAATNWHAWPESLYDPDRGEEWRVFPFLHTFPATDPDASEWVGPNCKQCPRTCELLKQIPGIRTALYSRMGPHTRLAPHQGWGCLANHVLRCHIALAIPEEFSSGVWVQGVSQFHKQGDILVFDDSRMHSGFNLSEYHRCVLIFDIMRPEGYMKGVASGGMTAQLGMYIEYFRQGGDAAACRDSWHDEKLGVEDREHDDSDDADDVQYAYAADGKQGDDMDAKAAKAMRDSDWGPDYEERM